MIRQSGRKEIEFPVVRCSQFLFNKTEFDSGVNFQAVIHLRDTKITLFLNFPTCSVNLYILPGLSQRYIHRVLQTIQMKLILLWVWAEPAVLGRAKTALKFKYEI